jgi:hypothetical protein
VLESDLQTNEVGHVEAIHQKTERHSISRAQGESPGIEFSVGGLPVKFSPEFRIGESVGIAEQLESTVRDSFSERCSLDSRELPKVGESARSRHKNPIHQESIARIPHSYDPLNISALITKRPPGSESRVSAAPENARNEIADEKTLEDVKSLSSTQVQFGDLLQGPREPVPEAERFRRPAELMPHGERTLRPAVIIAEPGRNTPAAPSRREQIDRPVLEPRPSDELAPTALVSSDRIAGAVCSHQHLLESAQQGPVDFREPFQRRESTSHSEQTKAVLTNKLASRLAVLTSENADQTRRDLLPKEKVGSHVSPNGQRAPYHLNSTGSKSGAAPSHEAVGGRDFAPVSLQTLSRLSSSNGRRTPDRFKRLLEANTGRTLDGEPISSEIPSSQGLLSKVPQGRSAVHPAISSDAPLPSGPMLMRPQVRAHVETKRRAAVEPILNSKSMQSIQVTIGRIEVRAVAAPAPVPAQRRNSPKVTALADYLKQRSGGKR